MTVGFHRVSYRMECYNSVLLVFLGKKTQFNIIITRGPSKKTHEPGIYAAASIAVVNSLRLSEHKFLCALDSGCLKRRTDTSVCVRTYVRVCARSCVSRCQ